MRRALVDLHNHILPGVDDGARDLDESIEIARRFVAEGVTRIAATPHYDAGNPPPGRGADASRVRSKIAELQPALDREGIPLVVLPGNEIYLTPETPELLANGTVSTLGGGTTALVELSLIAGERPLYLDALVCQLQLAGHRVVLAHPERYAFVERNLTSLDEAVSGGLVLQLTAPALLGEYGPRIRRTAERLLRRGSYALAASDRHHPGAGRSLAALHERIARLTDSDTADLLLCDNPARVLEGENLREPERLPDQSHSFLDRVLGRPGS